MGDFYGPGLEKVHIPSVSIPLATTRPYLTSRKARKCSQAIVREKERGMVDNATIH